MIRALTLFALLAAATASGQELPLGPKSRSGASENAALDTPLAEAARKPNILFILIDDLGWMDLRCQGNPHLLEPPISTVSRGRGCDSPTPMPRRRSVRLPAPRS
jgi:hypothetical protein